MLFAKALYLGQLHKVEEKPKVINMQLGGQDAESPPGYSAEDLDNLIKLLKIDELDIIILLTSRN